MNYSHMQLILSCSLRCNPIYYYNLKVKVLSKQMFEVANAFDMLFFFIQGENHQFLANVGHLVTMGGKNDGFIN